MNREIDISRLIFVQSAQISDQTLGGAYALHSLGSPSLSVSLSLSLNCLHCISSVGISVFYYPLNGRDSITVTYTARSASLRSSGSRAF